MIDINDIYRYNAELKEGLREMYNMLPPGQKKQVLKNDKVKACLVRYGVIDAQNERSN